MGQSADGQKHSNVPTTKRARIGNLASLATRIAGNVIKETSSQLIQGRRPSLSEALLAPSNAIAMAEKLAHMRGAAMKLGQLLSMDTGEFLPQSWEPILAQLRQHSHVMPQAQLTDTIKAQWGEDWYDAFKTFSIQPMAAASIGQVHRATLWEGQDVAVKIQYPGVKDSIDSDIDAVVWLLKNSRLLPEHINLDPILHDAKAQLHEEADYRLEAQHIERYAQCIKHDVRFRVPQVHTQLSTDTILVMDFLPGTSVESITEPKWIDWTVNALLELTLAELFDFKMMQSDPNFANFLLDRSTQTISLLDFGATQTIAPDIAEAFLHLAKAMSEGNKTMIESYLMQLGLVDSHMSRDTLDLINDACVLAAEAMQQDNYDIRTKGLVTRLLALTEPLLEQREATASPRFAIALINRKISGVILLASRLGAKLNIPSLLAPYLQRLEPYREAP